MAKAWSRRQGGRGWVPVLLLPILAFVFSALASPAAVAQAAAAEKTQERVWLDTKGKPIPLNEDELLEFLRTAEVVKRKKIKQGINPTQKLVLEKDGLKVHAIFREIDREMTRTRIDGRYYLRFVDHYAADVATYDLARKLGLTNVPPAVIRQVGRTPGSVQIWVENASEMPAEGFQPANPLAWVKQVWDRSFFDNLILNVDRNAKNILVGEDFTLWLIDHGRAFQPQGELLKADAIKMVNRKIWDRLEALSDEELAGIVAEYVDKEQQRCFVERRQALRDRVATLVAESGEDKVFY